MRRFLIAYYITSIIKKQASYVEDRMELPVSFSYRDYQPITSGWSIDKKYFIVLIDGTKAVLRLSPIRLKDHKMKTLSYLKQLSHLPVPQVLDYGVTTDEAYFYTLLSWIEGEVISDRLSQLPPGYQYQLGIEAGTILKHIHLLPIEKPTESWEAQFTKRIVLTIKRYQACGVTIDSEKLLLETIERFRDCLINRPQTYQHGDFHVGNFLMTPEGKLAVIDFDRSSFGDPFEEFDRLIWSHQKSPLFASGQIHGYFKGEPPLLFFQLLALYHSRGALNGIAWATDFGEEDIKTIKHNIKVLLKEHDNFRRLIPRWYIPIRDVSQYMI